MCGQKFGLVLDLVREFVDFAWPAGDASDCMPLAMIAEVAMKFVMAVDVVVQNDAAGGRVDGDLLDARESRQTSR